MSDQADIIAELRDRVRRLEALYGVIDLLAIPGVLAGGAARIFDVRHTADTLADRAIGFFPKEVAGRDLAIRWTRFPEPGEVGVPALEGYPFRLELTVLQMPHIATAEDLVVTLGEQGAVGFGEPQAEGRTLVFSGAFTPARTGLITAEVGSRAALETGGADARQLGLPFISLRSYPFLPSLAAAAATV